ncbi:HNH endonuclease signature motif containing protein, partial [Nocardiopsis mangrovi]
TTAAQKELTLDQLRADVAVGLLLGRLPVTPGLEIPADATEHGIPDTATPAPAHRRHPAPAHGRDLSRGHGRDRDGAHGQGEDEAPGQGECGGYGRERAEDHGQVVIPGMATPTPVPFSPVGKLHVIIPLAALPTEMGGRESRALAEIPGHGPILAEAARELAKEATDKATRWCYTVVDEEGTPVAEGTTRYRPPPRLRSHIDSRDRTCRFPHCNRPAVECDADHTTPHHLGGPTSAANLAALCRRHHRLKQHPGWKLSQPSPGTLIWRTPHHRTHTTVPDPYPGQ